MYYDILLFFLISCIVEALIVLVYKLINLKKHEASRLQLLIIYLKFTLFQLIHVYSKILKISKMLRSPSLLTNSTYVLLLTHILQQCKFLTGVGPVHFSSPLKLAVAH